MILFSFCFRATPRGAQDYSLLFAQGLIPAIQATIWVLENVGIGHMQGKRLTSVLSLQFPCSVSELDSEQKMFSNSVEEDFV